MKNEFGINLMMDALAKLSDLTDEEFDKLLDESGINDCPLITQEEKEELQIWIV